MAKQPPDPLMQPCRKGCGELVCLENDGFHVCRTSNQQSDLDRLQRIREILAEHDKGSGRTVDVLLALRYALRLSDETTESQVMLYELLSSARAELPDPDFVPDEDREIRLRKLRERIDAYLSVTDYMKLRSAVEPSEKPLQAETRAATSRDARSTEDAGRPGPTPEKASGSGDST